MLTYVLELGPSLKGHTTLGVVYIASWCITLALQWRLLKSNPGYVVPGVR